MKPADPKKLLKAWDDGKARSQTSPSVSLFKDEKKIVNGAPKKAIDLVVSALPADLLAEIEA